MFSGFLLFSVIDDDDEEEEEEEERVGVIACSMAVWKVVTNRETGEVGSARTALPAAVLAPEALGGFEGFEVELGGEDENGLHC